MQIKFYKIIVTPFRKNKETSEIRLWDLDEKIGHIDEVDLKVFDFLK